LQERPALADESLDGSDGVGIEVYIVRRERGGP
jgi:hypothetical protein